VVCSYAETRFNDSGGQPVLQEVQAILQGIFMELLSLINRTKLDTK